METPFSNTWQGWGSWKDSFFFSLYRGTCSIHQADLKFRDPSPSASRVGIKDVHYPTWLGQLLLIHDNYFILGKEFSAETSAFRFLACYLKDNVRERMTDNYKADKGFPQRDFLLAKGKRAKDSCLAKCHCYRSLLLFLYCAVAG